MSHVTSTRERRKEDKSRMDAVIIYTRKNEMIGSNGRIITERKGNKLMQSATTLLKCMVAIREHADLGLQVTQYWHLQCFSPLLFLADPHFHPLDHRSMNVKSCSSNDLGLRTTPKTIKVINNGRLDPLFPSRTHTFTYSQPWYQLIGWQPY